jgi:hypothetical protein
MRLVLPTMGSNVSWEHMRTRSLKTAGLAASVIASCAIMLATKTAQACIRIDFDAEMAFVDKELATRDSAAPTTAKMLEMRQAALDLHSRVNSMNKRNADYYIVSEAVHQRDFIMRQLLDSLEASRQRRSR